MSFPRLALLSVLSLTAASAFAAPVKLEDVAPDSSWFGHLDLDKALAGKFASTLGEQLRRPDSGVDLKLKELTEKTGIDPAKDLHGLTVYGDNSKENIVFLVYHSFDVGKFRASLNRDVKVEESVVDGVAILKMTKKGDDATYLSIRDKGPVVIAVSARSVVAAVRALGGKGVVPGAEWKAGPSARAPLFVMSARVDKLPLENAQSARIKDMKSATFTIEETSDNIVLVLRATTTDAAAAEKAASMANGVKSLASSGVKKAEQSALIDAIKVETSGATLTVGLPVPMKDVMKFVEQSVQVRATKGAATKPSVAK